MSKDKLAVSESFLSIQGEGQTMGKPAFFIRLTGCNLTCGVTRSTVNLAAKYDWDQESIDNNRLDDAKWVCDSIEVWMRGTSKTFQEIIDDLNEQFKFIERLKQGTHLIITGGEPLMQQDRVHAFLKYIFVNYNVKPTVEIETNGTILPTDALDWWVDFWNVSPKLSNSGMVPDKTKNLPAIDFHNKNPKSIFKFVILDEGDWLEVVNEWMGSCNVNPKKVWLMPGASDIDQITDRGETVADIAIKNNINYSTRMQINIWNKTVSV